MKLWIASYPRSGNSLTRFVLVDVFGLKTTSAFRKETESLARGTMLTGPYNFAGHYDECDFTPPGWIGVKTHDSTPPDEAAALYVVRDGRSALVSYWHFNCHYQKREVPMEEVIAGKVFGGSWSDHVRQWLDRPNTLVVKYDDLLHRLPQEVERISAFLGQDPIGEFSQPFAMMQERAPHAFRAADDAKNIAEMMPYIDIFDDHHAETMRRLGYYE